MRYPKTPIAKRNNAVIRLSLNVFKKVNGFVKEIEAEESAN